MPLIETNAADPMTFGMGKTTPHADQTKFRSMWACVEGDNDGRWPSVREAQEGIPVGNDGRYRLPFEPLRCGEKNSAYHDITVGRVKLREMIVPLQDAQDKDKYEGNLSTRVLENFNAVLEEKTAATRGKTERSTTFETHQ